MILFLLCTSVVTTYCLIKAGEGVTPKDCQDDPWFGE